MDGSPETNPPDDLAPPWTVEGQRDPHPWFARMLAERPIAYDPKADVWHVFRLADVQAFYREDDDWSSARRLEHVPREQRFVRLMTSDPPLHQFLRQFFSRAYRPRKIEGMEPLVRRVCARLINEALERGRLDVSADLAAPLASTMIRALIGVPEEDVNPFPILYGKLGHLQDTDDPDACMSIYTGGIDAEDQRAATAYFEDLVARRRTDPRDDMVSDLARIPADRFQERLDVGALLNEQLGAGQNTTMHLIGNMIWQLLEHPEELAKLRARPELAESTVEETLRYTSPVQARPRVSARPLRIHGVDIPDGAIGLGWIQAANLDPDAFPEPHRFRVDRRPNHHIAFGYGEHFCLGAWLARRAASVTLKEWLARVGSFEALEPEGIELFPDFLLRGPSALHVAVKPRA